MLERAPKNPAEALIWQFIDAQTGHDMAAVVQLFSDDFVRYGEETEWKAFGKENYLEWGEDFNVAFPDWNWEILELVGSGDTAALHVIESGTFSQPWVLRGRSIEPNHVRYVTHVGFFFRIEANRIKSYSIIHDSDFLRCYGELLDDGSITGAISKQDD